MSSEKMFVIPKKLSSNYKKKFKKYVQKYLKNILKIILLKKVKNFVWRINFYLKLESMMTCFN